LADSAEDITNCGTCEHRTEYSLDKPPVIISQGRWNYIPTSKLASDALRLCEQIPHDCAGIVGVPRSGMIVASLLATSSHLPLLEITAEHGLRQLGSGGRMWGKKAGAFGNGKLFVVDDSVHQGNAMNVAKDALGNNAIYATVYCRKEAASTVDMYVEEVPSPHLFEWNLFNSGNVSGISDDKNNWFHGGIAFDFDGIFCPDPPMPDADYGKQLDEYVQYLRIAPPTHMLPRYDQVPLIITLRLERWRRISEEWLRKNRVSWTKMVMCPLNKASERNGDGFIIPEEIIIEYKAKPYGESDCILMVESDPRQAELINYVTKKPVLCPATGEVFQET
jgi:hypothetical protein